MLAKTHLSITLLFVLALLLHVYHPISFVLLSFLATLMPDIDSKFSELGKTRGLGIVQIFLNHRGILHSILFLFFITFLLILFFPVFAFPFFLGYGLHLIADSFTVSGVRLIYPSKKIYSGSIKTGTRKETIIFLVFLMMDIALLASITFNQWIF